MTDNWVMYKAVPKAPSADFENYKAKPKSQPEINEKYQPDYLKKQYPLMWKLAEYLKDSPALEKAGNIAGQFNDVVEQSGLPSLAKGFFGSAIDMSRGVANLIPGVNIPKQGYNKLNITPQNAFVMETLGSLGNVLPVYKGYQAVKKGIELLPYAKKMPELIRKVLAGGAVGAAISPDNRKLGAALGGVAETIPFAIRGGKNYLQGRNTSGREKDLYKAMMEHEMQKADLESLKNLSTHKFGNNNPESLLLSAKDKAAQLEEAQAFKRHRLGDEKMLPGQQLIPEQENAVKNINEALKQTLGEGQTHSQDLSKYIVEAIEGVPTIEAHPKTGLPREVRVGGERKAWGAKMDELEHNLPEVEIPSTDTHSVDAALKSYFGKNQAVSEEEKEIFKKLIEAGYTINKKISGRQFFRAYRSLRTIEGKERSKAYGLDPKSHDEWIARANETKKTYEDMEKIIAKHFPQGTMKRLYELNHEYSNNIGPLHENPMYQQMLKHGIYSGNIANALSGTTSGNKILNNMIQNNPELSRLVLGHSFAENPAKLMKPNKAIEPFVRANPQIAHMMEYQKQAHSQLENAKHTAELHEHVKMIPKLSKEINEQRAIAERLKHESEVAGLTKAEVSKKKIEYEKAQKKLRSTKNKLIASTVASTVGTSAIIYAIKKLRE